MVVVVVVDISEIIDGVATEVSEEEAELVMIGV